MNSKEHFDSNLNEKTPFEKTPFEQPLYEKKQLQWSSPRAIEYAHQLISQIGLPSEIDPSPNGMMIWNAPLLTKTCFERIEVRSLNDNNFVFVFVNYDLPISKYVEVMDLTDFVQYDPLRKHLRARGPTLELCVSILTLAVQIGEGQLSLIYAVNNNLLKAYSGLSQNHHSYQRLYEYLSHLLKHQQGIPLMTEIQNDFPLPVIAPLPYNIY